MGDDDHESDEPDEERSQYGGAPNDIDAAEQTERAEDATDEDES